MQLERRKTNLSADPLAVFQNLAGQYDSCFLLETLGSDQHIAATGQSYIGVAPNHIYTARTGQFAVDGSPTTGQPLTELRKIMPKGLARTLGFAGGLVGYTTHEAIGLWEPSLHFDYPRQFPDFQLGEYHDGLIFQPGQAPDYFYYGTDRLKLYQAVASAGSALHITHRGSLKDQQAYTAMITKARADIRAGRVFQVVLANRYHYQFDGDLLQLYRRLRAINPSPYMFFLKFGSIVVLGASPELLMHVTPERQLYLEALAGTTRRGHDATEDKQLADRLLHDEKELAEHRMLVDLARNDVGRVSRIGSVEVERLMYIKRLSHVQHICSLVSGHLANDEDMFSALAATAPAGTLTGTPKIEAVKMIQTLEQVERGPYGGTVGYFSFGGDSVQAVNIRSVSATGHELLMHSGSGIVYDSRASQEFQEVASKKTAMDHAMTPFLERAP